MVDFDSFKKNAIASYIQDIISNSEMSEYFIYDTKEEAEMDLENLKKVSFQKWSFTRTL